MFFLWTWSAVDLDCDSVPSAPMKRWSTSRPPTRIHALSPWTPSREDIILAPLGVGVWGVVVNHDMSRYLQRAIVGICSSENIVMPKRLHGFFCDGYHDASSQCGWGGGRRGSPPPPPIYIYL